MSLIILKFYEISYNKKTGVCSLYGTRSDRLSVWSTSEKDYRFDSGLCLLKLQLSYGAKPLNANQMPRELCDPGGDK